MNMLDNIRVKVINAVGKKYGLRIQTSSSYTTSPYEGANSTRFRNTPFYKRAFEWSEDKSLTAQSRGNLTINTRDIQRNRGAVAGIIDQFADRTAGGSGIQPLPLPECGDEFAKEALDFWRDWRNVMDAQGRRKGQTIDKLNVKTRMPEGEVYFVKMANGQVMPVEGLRVTTPDLYKSEENKTVIGGIRVNKRGQPVGVYICPRKDGGTVNTAEFTYVPWAEVIPVGCSLVDRYDQLRSIPQMAPVLNRLRDQSELIDATLQKAKLDAYHGWAYMTEDDTQSSNQDDRTATQDTTTAGIRTELVDKAMIFHLGPDGKLESLASQTPNNTYKDFNEGLLREVAVRFGIPYEVMMLDMMGASYSGGHGIWQAATLTWNEWGLWLIQDWLQPLWNWRIGMAIRERVIRPADTKTLRNGFKRSLWDKVEWQMPRRMYWDDRGMASVNKLNLEMGIASVTGILRQNGQSRVQIFTETEEEIGDAMTRAERLSQMHPSQPVTWRDFMNSGTPGGQQVQRTSEPSRDGKKSDDENNNGEEQ